LLLTSFMDSSSEPGRSRGGDERLTAMPAMPQEIGERSYLTGKSVLNES